MYTYVERDDEIFCDIDHRHTLKPGQKPPPPVKLLLALDRLAGGMRDGALKVAGAYLYPSKTPLHYHLLVRLAAPMPTAQRVTWAGRLLDDPYRNLMNHERARRGVVGSLLITPQPYEARGVPYPRAPDHVCACQGSHKREDALACPVLKRLRGADIDAEYFGRRVYLRRRPVFGELDLTPTDQRCAGCDVAAADPSLHTVPCAMFPTLHAGEE